MDFVTIKPSILNAPLVSCPIPVIRFGWMQQQTHPKRMTGIGQLTRGAFRIIDLLWNPYFSVIQNFPGCWGRKSKSKKVLQIWGRRPRICKNGKNNFSECQHFSGTINIKMDNRFGLRNVKEKSEMLFCYQNCSAYFEKKMF